MRLLISLTYSLLDNHNLAEYYRFFVSPEIEYISTLLNIWVSVLYNRLELNNRLYRLNNRILFQSGIKIYSYYCLPPSFLIKAKTSDNECLLSGGISNGASFNFSNI